LALVEVLNSLVVFHPSLVGSDWTTNTLPILTKLVIYQHLVASLNVLACGHWVLRMLESLH